MMIQQNENDSKKEKKMKMVDQFMIAMFSPGEYGKLLKLSVGRLVAFLTCLLILVTVIQVVIPITGAIAGMGGLQNIFLNRIPDFELKDGAFTYNDRFEIKDEEIGAYVLIDTSKEWMSDDDLQNSNSYVEEILVGQKNMIIRNSIGGVQSIREEYKFSDFGSLHVNNEILAKYTPVFYGIIGFGFLASLISAVIRYLASALLYTGFVYFLTRMLPQQSMSFGEMYKVGLYAKTIGAIVVAVTLCIGGDLIILAGDTFAVFVTIMIMNRVCIRRLIQV